MTHSLHRIGDYKSLENDYVIFALTAGGKYGKELGHSFDSMNKKKKFFDVLVKNSPVNIGVCPTDDLRRITSAQGYSMKELRNGICDKSEIYSVFNNLSSIKKIVSELMRKDLGLSIVVSGIFEKVFKCCNEVKLEPHTVNMSLGIIGKTELLPDKKILEISTMCGHGLISNNLVQNLLEKVRKNTINEKEAAQILANQCVCGIFNTDRAIELIKKAVNE